METRKKAIAIPEGYKPTLYFTAVSGITQAFEYWYMINGVEMDHRSIPIGPENRKLFDRELGRAIGDDTVLEVAAWTEAPFVGKHYSRIRDAISSWKDDYDVAFETDDHWENGTWNDLNIGVKYDFGEAGGN